MRLSFRRLAAFTSLALICYSVALPIPVAFAQNVQVTLTDSSIQPKTIQANQSVPVRITIVNKGSKVHNFVVPKFYVFSPNIQPNGTVNVRFTPDKTGTFQYYSDKNGVPEKGLNGILYVHPT